MNLRISITYINIYFVSHYRYVNLNIYIFKIHITNLILTNHFVNVNVNAGRLIINTNILGRSQHQPIHTQELSREDLRLGDSGMVGFPNLEQTPLTMETQQFFFGNMSLS